MNYQIKELTYEDIKHYMNVNIDSWLETYPGIVDNEFLQDIDTNREKYIARQQKKYLENKSEKEKKFLLLVNNEPVGMTSCGISNDGKILFINNVNELIKMGFTKMVIGCLKANPSNDFYKHMGGKLINTYLRKTGNKELEENVYYFSNLKDLIK